MLKNIILSIFILALTGCNTGQYQSYQSGYGYQSETTEDNSYYVTYTGSPKSKIEKVNDFTLLRCAELALEKGYDYFVITKAENNKIALGNSAMSAAEFNDIGRINSLALGVAGTTERTKAKSELTIMLFNEKPEGIYYEASIVSQALKSEYGILE